LGIASTTIWNALKKKETTEVQSNRRRTGRPRKTTVADDRSIVRAVKKTPKTSVSDITNDLHSAGVKVSQSTVRRRLREQKYRGQDANHSSEVRIGRPDWNLQRSTEMSRKSSGTQSCGLIRPRLISTKVMERPKCGEAWWR